MASIPKIKLTPVDDGESVDIPDGRTTVGRGTFLQVTDKRVSRNHAVVEINCDGKLVITPIHTNPCFFKLHGTGSQTMLQKDQPKILEHDDVVSLLPDKFAYRVVYEDIDNKKKPCKENSDNAVTKNDSEPEAETETKPPENEENVEQDEKESDSKPEDEMALPLGKKRTLPDWMVGAGKRIGIGQKKKQINTVQPAVKAPPRAAAPKPPPKKKPTVVSRTPRKMKHVVSDDDDDFIHDDDDDEEDFDDDELVTKKRVKRRSSGRQTRRARRARDSDEEEAMPKRRPRAASLKKPKYTDEDFVISDDEIEYREPSSEGSEAAGRRRRGSVDSDFVADDDESGSDWESVRKPVKTKQQTPKVKSPSVGRGRGTGNRRGSGRGRGQKRVVRSEEEEESDEEKYIPRSSKRRAAVAAVSRMKQPSDYEDDDFDDVLPARPAPITKPVVKTSTGRPRGRPPRAAGPPAGRGRKPLNISDDDSDAKQNNVNDSDSAEELPVKKRRGAEKTKPTCQFGKECYRKNPKHFEEFAHPWLKSSATDNNDRDDSKMDSPPNGGRQKRAAALKQKEKLAAMNEASDDDDDDDIMNGSHDDDNAGAEDSDFDMDTSTTPSRINEKLRA